MGLLRRRAAELAADHDPVPGNVRIGAQIAEAVAVREAALELTPPYPITREAALNLSVINRGRDLICGVLGDMPFTRSTTFGLSDGAEPRELGPGWLEHPDPTRTRQSWTADVVDDLIFHGWAACHVTARDPQGFPTALVHIPWVELTPPLGHRSRRRGTTASRTTASTARADWWDWLPDPATAPVGGPGVRSLFDLNMVVFESPLTGVLEHPAALLIALRLDRAASRFAASTVPIGWLEQVAGSAAMSGEELTALARSFADAREGNAIAALNEAVRYHESSLDPDRMQLVQARTYQDAAQARVINVPAFLVGAVTPGDSMTYKSAQQSRWDLLSFGVGPYMTCLADTLSMPGTTPRGTTVGMDPTPFLQTAALAAVDSAAAPVLAPVGGNP